MAGGGFDKGFDAGFDIATPEPGPPRVPTLYRGAQCWTRPSNVGCWTRPANIQTEDLDQWQ